MKVSWPGMTNRQHKRLGRYVRELANVLGLYEWSLLLGDEPADDDALTSVVVTDGQNRAVISVCKDFNTLELREKRRALIHELVHCHEQKAMETVTSDTSPLPDLLGLAAWEVFVHSISKDHEIMVDNLAIVIASMVDDSAFIKYLEKS